MSASSGPPNGIGRPVRRKEDFRLLTGRGRYGADAWEPLFAIAELGGGEWPQRARRAALLLSGEQVVDDENIDTQLLSDIRDLFTTDQMPSQTLVTLLNGLEDRRWAEYGRNGKGLTQNTLARLLKPYKIRPATVRTGPGEKDTAKGYKLSQFIEVFERYLPNPADETVTPSQVNENKGFSHSQTVTPDSDVTDEKAQKASTSAGCDGVTDGNAPENREYADLPPEEETAL